jgi:antimicrobial peptide system SdpB family protein
MNEFIERLRQINVHTEKLAIARFLLALGVAFTLLFNDMKVVANHQYTTLPGYVARHQSPTPNMRKTNLFYLLPPAAAKAVAIIILVFVMSGYFPDMSCLLHLYVNVCVHSYFIIFNGGDQVAVLLSFLLVPVCMTDPRRNQWQKATVKPRTRNIIANVAMFAIQLQAAIIYLYSGVSKAFVTEWQEGTAVYYYISNHRTGAPDWLRSINELITLTPIVAVISWGVIMFEILLFACLFASPKIRHVFFIMALSFHFLIILNFGLVTFFLSMAALLVLFLDDQNASVKLLDKLKRKFRPRTTSIA